jgi:hypothetical protein
MAHRRDNDSPEAWQADIRAVDTIATPTSAGKTLASFVVEDGVPGATQVFPAPSPASAEV